MPKRFHRVYIEISNVCNLQCSFCPEVDRQKRFMEPDLFRAVAAEVAPLCEEVCFHLMGEPLLHPHLESYVEHCGTLNLPINLTTNGILLDERRAGALLHPAIRQVNVSLQSFESNFPGRDNTEYLGRIFDFTRRALRERPDLYINYRLWNEGTPEAQQSNKRILDQIRTALNALVNAPFDLSRKKNVPVTGRVSVHHDLRFTWPHPHQPVRSETGFCHGLSNHIGILADGTVVPCCLDKEGVVSLGTCGTQSISDIVSSPRAQKIRAGFQNGILVEDLCKRCTFITRFQDKAERITQARSASLA